MFLDLAGSSGHKLLWWGDAMLICSEHIAS